MGTLADTIGQGFNLGGQQRFDEGVQDSLLRLFDANVLRAVVRDIEVMEPLGGIFEEDVT